MKQNYYILSNGILKRKQNTVFFINKDGKRVLPIEKIYAIYAYGRITFSSGVVSYLAKYGVPIHFFNMYGGYEGSFYPREGLLSGEVLIKQAEHYLDKDKRIYLAQKFVEGAAKNIMRNLSTYGLSIEFIETLLEGLLETKNIPEIMNIEGRIREHYYNQIDTIVPEEFQIGQRTRRPPTNMMNCLISFGNQLLYSTIVTEIYNTQLNPTISYLHEPFERRFSLALDIAEIFKPIIVDRLIFKLVNKKMVNKNCFRKELNAVLLNEKGKRLFLNEYENKLRTTIKHKQLRRKVSYQRLIRLELYKLIKHLIGMEKYKPLVMWW